MCYAISSGTEVKLACKIFFEVPPLVPAFGARRFSLLFEPLFSLGAGLGFLHRERRFREIHLRLSGLVVYLVLLRVSCPHSLFHICCSTLSSLRAIQSTMASSCRTLFQFKRFLNNNRIKMPESQVDLFLRPCHRCQHCRDGPEDHGVRGAAPGASQRSRR